MKLLIQLDGFSFGFFSSDATPQKIAGLILPLNDSVSNALKSGDAAALTVTGKGISILPGILYKIFRPCS
jgi:hypothetical protein